MTVREIREVSQPSARAWIEKDGNVLFADWFYKVPEDLLTYTPDATGRNAGL